MATYAYARVSACDQNLDRQIDAFINYGINCNRIYADKKSGKDLIEQAIISSLRN